MTEGKKMKEKYYITTAIAYASKKPHFGNTYEAIMTDALTRYKKEMGYLGKVSGKDVPDKIEQAGLHIEYVDGQPTFAEATVIASSLFNTVTNDIEFATAFEPSPTSIGLDVPLHVAVLPVMLS